jgi:hypothetical protein
MVTMRRRGAQFSKVPLEFPSNFFQRCQGSVVSGMKYHLISLFLSCLFQINEIASQESASAGQGTSRCGNRRLGDASGSLVAFAQWSSFRRGHCCTKCCASRARRRRIASRAARGRPTLL